MFTKTSREMNKGRGTLNKCPYNVYLFDVDKAEDLNDGPFAPGEKVHLVYNPSRKSLRKDVFLLPDGQLVCDKYIDMWHGTSYVLTALNRGAVYLGVGIIHSVDGWW